MILHFHMFIQSMLKPFLDLSAGDTWRIDVSSSSNSWVQISTTVSPDPRYGFVGGVIGNYWIISHGKSGLGGGGGGGG